MKASVRLEALAAMKVESSSEVVALAGQKADAQPFASSAARRLSVNLQETLSASGGINLELLAGAEARPAPLPPLSVQLYQWPTHWHGYTHCH